MFVIKLSLEKRWLFSPPPGRVVRVDTLIITREKVASYSSDVKRRMCFLPTRENHPQLTTISVYELTFLLVVVGSR